MAVQTKTIFSVIYKALFDSVVYTVIISVLLALLPNQLFSNFPLEPASYNQNIPENISNWNTVLSDRSEFLNVDEIVGPESLHIRGDSIFTGLADGRLVEINKKSAKIKDITRFPRNSKTEADCPDNNFWRLTQCGRPLGIRLDKGEALYVVDGFQGLFRVNLTTNEKELIKLEVGPDFRAFYNDFVFDPTLDVVYITVSSTKWLLDQVPWSILDYEDTGNVLAVDLKTRKVVKILDGLRFANGIEIVDGNLLVSETVTLRILKIPLKSVHKAIKSNTQVPKDDISIFAEDLPGEPDNMRVDPSGNLLVGIFLARSEGKSLRDQLAGWPFIRKAIGRTSYLLSLIFDFVNTNIYSSQTLESIWFHLHSGHLLYKLMPTNGAILQLDGKTGQIIKLLGSNKFNGISEAVIDSDGDLYFGSFRNRFLGKLKKGQF